MLPHRPNLQGKKLKKKRENLTGAPTLDALRSLHRRPDADGQVDEQEELVEVAAKKPKAGKLGKKKDDTPALVLSQLQKRHLRGLGHKIDPTVNLGKEGLAPNARKNLEAQLLRHELIKVKLNNNVAELGDELLAEVTEVTGAVLVFQIGHIGLFYRPHPTAPKLVLPATAKKSRRLLRAPRGA